jgi:hypothetical protein
VVLMARDTSEPCLAAWLSTHLALAAANGVQKGGRDQTALGSLLRNKSEHACTVGRLPEAYFRNVVVTRTKDLRVFQHITRTGLLVRKNLNDSDWYAFGQTLLGIDADGGAPDAPVAAAAALPALPARCRARWQTDRLPLVDGAQPAVRAAGAGQRRAAGARARLAAADAARALRRCVARRTALGERDRRRLSPVRIARTRSPMGCIA